MTLFPEPGTSLCPVPGESFESEEEREPPKSSSDSSEGIVFKRRPKHVNCSCSRHRENGSDFPGEMQKIIISEVVKE